MLYLRCAAGSNDQADKLYYMQYLYTHILTTNDFASDSHCVWTQRRLQLAVAAAQNDSSSFLSLGSNHFYGHLRPIKLQISLLAW